MFHLKNPIPEQVRDTGKLREFFVQVNKDHKLIVPYYGTGEHTSHSFLDLLYNLSTRSPSFKACDSDLNRYCFGSRLDISQARRPGFLDEEDEPVSREQKIGFIDTLNGLGIRLPSIIKLSGIIETHLRQSGNAYLWVRIGVVDGIYQVSMDVVHYRRCAYLLTGPGQEKRLVVVEDWDIDYYRKNKKRPVVVKASQPDGPFNWTQRRGIFETIVHYRIDGNDDSDWYGRPDILSVLEWLYAEIALGSLSCKVNDNEVITRNILAFEDEGINVDEEGNPTEKGESTNFKAVINTLRKISTAEGSQKQVKGLAAIQYPTGTNAPTNIVLEVNRDSTWFEKNIDKASAYICSVLGWSRELLNLVQAKSGIGSQMLINRFLIHNSAIVEPTQEKHENYWSRLFTEIGKVVGAEELITYGIRFENKIEKLVEQLQGTESTNDEPLLEPTNPEIDEPQDATQGI